MCCKGFGVETEIKNAKYDGSIVFKDGFSGSGRWL